LERISLFDEKKRPATRLLDHDEISDTVETIQSYYPQGSKDPTVEDILEICTKIKNMEFEFPP